MVRDIGKNMHNAGNFINTHHIPRRLSTTTRSTHAAAAAAAAAAYATNTNDKIPTALYIASTKTTTSAAAAAASSTPSTVITSSAVISTTTSAPKIIATTTTSITLSTPTTSPCTTIANTTTTSITTITTTNNNTITNVTTTSTTTTKPTTTAAQLQINKNITNTNTNANANANSKSYIIDLLSDDSNDAGISGNSVVSSNNNNNNNIAKRKQAATTKYRYEDDSNDAINQNADERRTSRRNKPKVDYSNKPNSQQQITLTVTTTTTATTNTNTTTNINVPILTTQGTTTLTTLTTTTILTTGTTTPPTTTSTTYNNNNNNTNNNNNNSNSTITNIDIIEKSNTSSNASNNSSERRYETNTNNTYNNSNNKSRNKIHDNSHITTTQNNNNNNNNTNNNAGQFSRDFTDTRENLLTNDACKEILTGLEGAAFQSRLPYDKMTTNETACFPDITKMGLVTQRVFLNIRNRILQMWIENPKQELTYKSAYANMETPFDSDPVLVKRVHSFLERHGFINFGIFKRLQALPEKKFGKVIVIGSGISGLAAAQQLQQLGMEVVVLEARERVGGRIATFRKNNYIADLGALVVTGVWGNPMTILSKQLNLEMIPIKQTCRLYGSNGKPVPKHKDDMIEREFNRLLESASYLSHQLDFNYSGNNPVSLGQALEWIIKMQEKAVKEKYVQYLRTLIAAQMALINVQQRITLIKKQFARLKKLRENHLKKNVIFKGNHNVPYAVTRKLHLRSSILIWNSLHRLYQKLLKAEKKYEDRIKEIENNPVRLVFIPFKKINKYICTLIYTDVCVYRKKTFLFIQSLLFFSFLCIF